MGDYVDSFGLVRFVGRGEGVDNLYDASAKPAEGACNAIEIKFDGEGIVPNVGTGYDRGQAYLPAGSVIGRSILFIEEKGSASALTLSLVDKDGNAIKDGNDDPIVLTSSAITPTANGEAYNVNAANGKQVPLALDSDGDILPSEEQKNGYIKMGGTFTGCKGVLKIEYV